MKPFLNKQHKQNIPHEWEEIIIYKKKKKNSQKNRPVIYNTNRLQFSLKSGSLREMYETLRKVHQTVQDICKSVVSFPIPILNSLTSTSPYPWKYQTLLMTWFRQREVYSHCNNCKRLTFWICYIKCKDFTNGSVVDVVICCNHAQVKWVHIKVIFNVDTLKQKCVWIYNVISL